MESVQSPRDLRALSRRQLVQLAAEIRSFLITKVSRTGGHLGPNLGVVELTISLLRAFDPIETPIVWDVGHQTYAYKMLTGRCAAFPSLRRKDGISGFPKREESPYDAFNTGHSSTSISVGPAGAGWALK